MPVSAAPTWQTRVLAALRAPGAPRVFSLSDLQEWVAGMGIDVSPRAVAYNLATWEQAGVFLRVARGLHVNRLATPAVRPDEAASCLRAGAIISLQRVLGQHGILNNPTDWITAVVPTGVSAGTGAEGIVTPIGTFHFANIRPDFLSRPDATWQADALDALAPVPTATPEKALLDWLYLATVPNGRNPPLPPRGDVDVEGLDRDRLARLAAAMGLEQAWAAWDRVAFPVEPSPRSRARP